MLFYATFEYTGRKVTQMTIEIIKMKLKIKHHSDLAGIWTRDAETCNQLC